MPFWVSICCLALLPLFSTSALVGKAYAGETEEEECENAPSCWIVPNIGTIEAIVDQPFSVTICGVSNCGNDVSIESWRFNPDWCDPVYGDSRGTNGQGEPYCIDIVCTPPLTALGTRTFKFKITDLENGEEVWCEFKVHTTLPCLDIPSCRTIPSGVVEVVAGEDFNFEFCATSTCTEHRFEIVPVMVPDWCHPAPGMMNVAHDSDQGEEHCFNIHCDPPSDTPPGRYWVKLKVIDLETGLQDNCVLDIDILEPPCDEDPVCEISALAPALANGDSSETFNIKEGDVSGFQICGTSLCGNDIEIDTSNLPDFCSVGNGDDCSNCAGGGNHEGEHTECVWIDCEPGPGDAGSYHAVIWVTDHGNYNRSRCDVWINVEAACENEPPTCGIVLEPDASPREVQHNPGPLRVQVGEPFEFMVCGKTACDDHRARVAPSGLPPFVTNPGHKIGGPGDEVCLEVEGEARPIDVGNWNVHFVVKDLDTNLTTDCWLQIIVEGAPVCEDRPVCTVEPSGEIPSSPGAMHSIEICGAPVCEDHAVEIEAVSLPEFCGPFEKVTGEVGMEVCAMLDCTVPMDAAPGTYELKFRVRDTTNLQVRLCTVTLEVARPTVLGCFEDDQPNNDITECSMFDAGDCFDIGCGSAINGTLDQSGEDFDYYCVGGLEPGSDYTVTIIGGTQPDGMPGCYAIACLDLNGNVLNSTNTGQSFGYPTITCVADGDGFVYFAVSGCEDLDIDGQDDNAAGDAGDSRGGIGHGSRGSYIIAVDFGDPFNEINVACHADMNGDGKVDSGDLGMLIGAFGSTCDRHTDSTR